MEGLPEFSRKEPPVRADQISRIPARPDSVADWEELLVRLEIVPRVVRNTADEVEDTPSAVRLLRAAVGREAEVGRWLDLASGADEPASHRGDSGAGADVAELSLRFASLRARTFAMVQRRGLEVWRWEGPLSDGVSVTLHQLLLWLAGRDAVLLADLREATRTASAGC